jgi:molybdate transport system substrate-binding protein
MGHPLKLLRDGRATRAVMFTRNTLCGIAVPRVGLTTANFLDRLLDPTVKLGTSTPKADPSGDYTWTMFRRADALCPGSYELLDGKAQKIVGGPSNNDPFDGKDPAVAALAASRVDIVIGYCTGAKSRLSQMAELQVAEVPHEIAAGPEYGLAVLTGGVSSAADLALFMLSPEGQQIFFRYGFAPIALPASERRAQSAPASALGSASYVAARSFPSTDSARRTQ